MEITKIAMNGHVYPIMIDLNVLSDIQNNYGTIYQFERDINGIIFQKDNAGNIILNEDGTPKYIKAAPNIAAIIFVLPRMINEGLKAEAYENNTSYKPVDPEKIIYNCDIAPEVLADIIKTEYSRCFAVKK